MIEQYKKLDQTDAWTAEIMLRASIDPTHAQEIVNAYVAESGITVVGFYSEEERLFSMHRWPESRLETHRPTPSLELCTQALLELAELFNTPNFQEHVLLADEIQVVMGRKLGGYGPGKEVGIAALYSPLWTVIAGHLISARALVDGGIEPYGERAGRIRAQRTPENIDAVGRLADKLQQFHIAIEAESSDATVLYQWWKAQAA